MFNLWLLAYPLLGIVVGFLAGLLGIGGGAVMVPALTSLFLAQGFPFEQVVHMALATSMATIILTSFSSARAHHARGAVDLRIFWRIAPGILVGTSFGVFAVSSLNTVPLAVSFACFMAFIATQLLTDTQPKAARELPGTFGMCAVGLFIGFISALVSIGGGSLSVPFMLWCNVEARRAMGTSAAIGFPIAVSATANYLIAGWTIEGLPTGTVGYIYLPALVLVGGVSVFMAPIGAACAHRMPVSRLRKIFACLLILLSLKMLKEVIF